MKTKGFVCLCSFLPWHSSLTRIQSFWPALVPFPWSTSSDISCKSGQRFLLVTDAFHFYLSEKAFIFPSLLISLYTGLQGGNFLLSAQNTSIHSPCLRGLEEFRVTVALLSVQVRRFFSGYSQDSLYLFFGFLQFEYNMPQSRFGIYHIWSSKLSGMVVWCPSLSLENSPPLLLQTFLLLLSILPWWAQRPSLLHAFDF